MNDNSVTTANDNSTVGIVDFAQVMSGASSFKDAGIANVTDTYQGQILTRNKELKTAILKDLAPKELANEIMAASLASALDLPVPPAFIGITEPGNPCATRTIMQDGRGLMFVSVNVNSPSVASLVKRPTDQETLKLLRPIVELLAKESWLGNLYGFDAWIANVDRHVGNVLFATGANIWIIDHGRCFTGPAWTKADLVAAGTYTHRLREWVTLFLSAAERKRLANEAAALPIRLCGVDVREAGTKNSVVNLIGASDFEALISFLTDRIPFVPRAAGDALDEPRIA
ncbi:HipA family kinase [Roseixanthobacter pseudopolyaromaticivorans]|uniref:HipA family kinase n=1 Tax=Xanthobacteraceae TaxID=335928 RepID=UPI003726A9C3